MDESLNAQGVNRVLAAARQRIGVLADPPPLDEESVRARHDELAQQHPGTDASACEGELERQVLLALEDVLTPGQWRAVMGSAPFGEGEGEPAALRTARGLDGLELLDAACQAAATEPAAPVHGEADIGTYGAALWPARAQRGPRESAPLVAWSGALLPSAADAETPDTRRLNRPRRAGGGESHGSPLGPMGACFPEAAASRRPAGDPPDQDLAALPDAMLDDLTD